MNAKFYVKYDCPIHKENPGLQTDHCRLDMTGVTSKETALETVERWKRWFIVNKCFNAYLYEAGDGYAIETPILLE